MPGPRRHAPCGTPSLPLGQFHPAGLPTPPDEGPPLTDATLFEATNPELQEAWRQNAHTNALNEDLQRQMQGVEAAGRQWMRVHQDKSEASRPNYYGSAYSFPEAKWTKQGFQQERYSLAGRIRGLEEGKDGREDLQAEYAEPGLCQLDNTSDFERKLWEAQVKELQSENQHLQHTIYMNALETANNPPSWDTTNPDRSDTRNLRQQLACMDEHFHSLNEKTARLQEQVIEAHRLLAVERQERLDERNRQLTVVVAKHGLERRMRNREQDLQAEWQRNAELAERCRKLEEDLAKARESPSDQGHSFQLPFRGHEKAVAAQDAANEDDWTDTPTHVPPEFGYSKFVRWKKRAREAHDHGFGSEKKQRRSTPDAGRMQLAGSESPPLQQMLGEAGQAGPGASAIDHMISGEFVESEMPSRAVTSAGS